MANAPLADEMAEVLHPENSEEPLSNPVLNPERMKGMAEKFRELTGQKKPDKNAPPPPQPPTTSPPDAVPQAITKPAPAPTVQAPPPVAPKPAPAKSEPPKPPTPEKVEPKPAAPEPPVEFDPSHLSTSAREGFKRLQQSRDDFKKQLDERSHAFEEATARLKALEKELADTKSALPPDIEVLRKAVTERDELKKQAEDLTKQVETINLERSPRFQNWWKTETDKHIKAAQRSLPSEKREELAKLMNESPSTERSAAIEALYEGLPSRDQAKINREIDAMDDLREQREEALRQGSEQWKKLKEHEQQESHKVEETKKATLKRLSDGAVERARNLSSFQASDDATHNATVRENEAFVRAFVGGQLDEETMLVVPGMAVEALALQEQVKTLTAELAKRDEAIKSLQAASPAPHDGGTTQRAPETPRPGQAFLTRYKEATRR